MITISGKSYFGNNISIINGNVSVDGNVAYKIASESIKIEITGNLANLTSDAPVSINGNVKGNVEVDGPLNCKDICGDVIVNGPLCCGKISGNVKSSGPVIHG